MSATITRMSKHIRRFKINAHVVTTNNRNKYSLYQFNLCRLPVPLNTQRLKTFHIYGMLRNYTTGGIEHEMPIHVYDKISEETLQNLTEVLDQLLEEFYQNEFDVSFANGVLKVQLEQHGTYVLNKQTPNRQIWLSSPTSGPKRYDYLGNKWIYSHDKSSLDYLLTDEFSKILNRPVKIVSLKN